MGFSVKQKAERQKIVDDYLKRTRRKAFVPVEFLEWLRDKKDHPAFDVFYGKSDSELAHEQRKHLVRKWVDGLRITVVERETTETRLHVREFVVPAVFSPVAGRAHGGGYVVTNVNSPAHLAELYSQAAQGLEMWLERHGGVAEIAGVDLSSIKEIVGDLRKSCVSKAA